MDFEQSSKNGKFRQKVKGLTLTFWRLLTIFEIFLKRFKKFY